MPRIKRTCPVCGKTYNGYPAQSRSDNQTLICPECGMQEAVMTALLADYSFARQFLSFDVVPTRAYKEQLDDIPHFEMCDLSIVYRIRLSEENFQLKSILITNDMLRNYGMSQAMLKKDTSENVSGRFPVVYQSLKGLFRDTLGITDECASSDPGDIMYAATVKSHVRGAGVLAYPDFFEKTAELLRGDFFVLPSSIHEVIVLKDTADFSANELVEMVRDINETVVSPVDRLIDNAYHYDHTNHIFETAVEYEKRKSL